VRALRPCQPAFGVDPDRKPHAYTIFTPFCGCSAMSLITKVNSTSTALVPELAASAKEWEKFMSELRPGVITS
jgi:hypothetical protein